MNELPYNETAERELLSSVFLDGIETIQKALDAKVDDTSFHNPKNALIWKTILWAFKRGTPLELGAISSALKERGKLDAIGGLDYLLEVTRTVPTTAGTEFSIKKVQECLMLREIIRHAEEAKTAALGYTGDISQFAATLESALKLREGLEKQATIQDACKDIDARIDRILKGEPNDRDKGYSWPWSDANRFLGPIQPGELVIVAARPSRGKSSVARQLAWHWSEKYGEVLLFSREMPVSELPPLFAQSLCGYSWRELRHGRMHTAEVLEFKESLLKVRSNSSLRVFDRDRTLSQIVARVKGCALKRKPAAIIIDYLQIYDPEQSKGETRDQALGRFTRAAHDLALEHSIPVILLCQLNRESAREETPPKLHNLRESGSIEQDASRVVAIHWPTEHEGVAQDFSDQTLTRVQTKLIQLKGRSEGEATASLVFHRPTATFIGEAKE